MQIVIYPHPTLRYPAKPVQRIDAALRRTIAEMFETMYEAKGIGLAANQVDLPLRIFVANLGSEPHEEDTVFINPVLSQAKGRAEDEEGCLSLPRVYARVRRPERIRVQAFDLSGNPIDRVLDGLAARVVQHETDHLDGILFIDRLSESELCEVQPKIEEFELEYHQSIRQGHAEPTEVIFQRLASVEAQYCQR